MFPKKQRISRKEFVSVYKKSRSFNFPPLSFKVSLIPKGQKFSVVLPGSWQKKKSLRNKIKRRIIDILKKSKDSFPENLAVICFVKKEASLLPHKELSLKINTCVEVIKNSFPRGDK